MFAEQSGSLLAFEYLPHFEQLYCEVLGDSPVLSGLAWAGDGWVLKGDQGVPLTLIFMTHALRWQVKRWEMWSQERQWTFPDHPAGKRMLPCPFQFISSSTFTNFSWKLPTWVLSFLLILARAKGCQTPITHLQAVRRIVDWNLGSGFTFNAHHPGRPSEE